MQIQWQHCWPEAGKGDPPCQLWRDADDYWRGSDRGIPSLAVFEPDGKVVVAQKDGEFESIVRIGPEEIDAFLET